MKSIKMKLATGIVAIGCMCSAVINTGCNWNKTAKGGAIGAGSGAVIGGAIGSRSGNTIEGAIIGAAIGGAAGAGIGRYMDKQAEELQKDLENATVERVGEGIRITFNSGLLFDVNSHQLKAEAKRNLDDMARVVKKYDDTNILIEGHTDDTGDDASNDQLSERRANSVSHYLTSLGVDKGRMSTIGYGEKQPVADNKTDAGKQQNRRVEVAITANKKLQKAAEKGDI